MKKIWEVAENGTIRFTVGPSDGTTGPLWITRLMRGAKRIGDYAMGSLLSPDFVPTTGVTTKMIVLSSRMFFGENNRATVEQIRSAALSRWGATSPSADTACLAREMLSDDDLRAMATDLGMGMNTDTYLERITFFHQPIRSFITHRPGAPDLLAVSLEGLGHKLDGSCGKPDTTPGRHNAFAFAIG
jgi:hypothetical protein